MRLALDELGPVVIAVERVAQICAVHQIHGGGFCPQYDGEDVERYPQQPLFAVAQNHHGLGNEGNHGGCAV